MLYSTHCICCLAPADDGCVSRRSLPTKHEPATTGAYRTPKKASTTKQSLRLVKPSASIQNLQSLTASGESPTSRRLNTTKPSPISPKPFESTQSSATHTTIG